MVDTTFRTPYSSAMPFIKKGGLPGWLTTEYDQQRLASYDLYDDLYENSPSVEQLMIRGTNEDPKLLPTAKRVVKTMARYVGRGWGYTVAPETTTPGEDEPSVQDLVEANAAAVKAIDDLFVREDLVSEVRAGIKPWLRRGDWVWYISADEDKDPGSRISVVSIDPRTYFPIMDDPENLSRVTGARIVEQIELPNVEEGVTYVKIQEYLKPTAQDYDESIGQGFITYSSFTYALDKWEDPVERERIQTNQDLMQLSNITQLPLYLVQNNKETANPYGTSDLAGLENLIVGINQAFSDQDEALAMAGQGMYVTDSGAPIDPATKRPMPWILGAKRVVQVGKGNIFQRIAGITSVQPSKDHIEMMEDRAYGAVGLNDVALGSAEGQLSGVAYAIKLSPTFDEADSKDDALNGTWNHILYDLREWFLEFEDIDISGVVFRSTTDAASRLPFDRAERFQELIELKSNGIIDDDYFRDQMRTKFGYDIPVDAESVSADPLGDRATGELDAE